MKKLMFIAVLFCSLFVSAKTNAQCTAGVLPDSCQFNAVHYITGAPSPTNNWYYLITQEIMKVKDALNDGSTAGGPGVKQLSELHRVLDSSILADIDTNVVHSFNVLKDIDTLVHRQYSYKILTGTCSLGIPFTVPANSVLIDVMDGVFTHKNPIAANFTALPTTLDMMCMQSTKLTGAVPNYNTVYGTSSHTVTTNGYNGYYVIIQFY